MLAATLFHLPDHIPKKGLDLLEIRIDSLKESEEEILQFMRIQDRSILLTCRRQNREEGDYITLLYKLASWGPQYLDVEMSIPLEVIQKIKKLHPTIKIILSWHSEEPLSSYDELYTRMQKADVDFYKIVVNAHKGVDALRLLHFLSRHRDGKLIAFCMGEKGQFTRILSKALGGALHFCSIDPCPPYSQFSLDELLKIYSFDQINLQTKLYGLIGTPVDKSPSNITHNEVFRLMNKNACYVKIDLSKDEVQEGVNLLEELGFQGLSVTMPLKSAFQRQVIFADPISKKLGIINTLVFSRSIVGYNTDALALEEMLNKYQVRRDRVLLIGAGAVAQILSFLLYKRGCFLLHWNRTVENLDSLRECYGGILYDESLDYDVLINATAQGMDGVSLPIDQRHILPGKKVFDLITVPKWTPLLSLAKERECALVFGEEMFALQAAFQLSIWNSF